MHVSSVVLVCGFRYDEQNEDGDSKALEDMKSDKGRLALSIYTCIYLSIYLYHTHNLLQTIGLY